MARTLNPYIQMAEEVGRTFHQELAKLASATHAMYKDVASKYRLSAVPNLVEGYYNKALEQAMVIKGKATTAIEQKLNELYTQRNPNPDAGKTTEQLILEQLIQLNSREAFRTELQTMSIYDIQRFSTNNLLTEQQEQLIKAELKNREQVVSSQLLGLTDDDTSYTGLQNMLDSIKLTAQSVNHISEKELVQEAKDYIKEISDNKDAFYSAGGAFLANGGMTSFLGREFVEKVTANNANYFGDTNIEKVISEYFHRNEENPDLYFTKEDKVIVKPIPQNPFSEGVEEV